MLQLIIPKDTCFEIICNQTCYEAIQDIYLQVSNNWFIFRMGGEYYLVSDEADLIPDRILVMGVHDIQTAGDSLVKTEVRRFTDLDIQNSCHTITIASGVNIQASVLKIKPKA